MCVEVDRCLQDAIAYNTFLLLLKQVVVGSHPVVFDKLTWSSVKCILVVFAVIVVEVVLVIESASRHAADNRHTFTFT
jgi:hypothetical protein